MYYIAYALLATPLNWITFHWFRKAEVVSDKVTTYVCVIGLNMIFMKENINVGMFIGCKLKLYTVYTLVGWKLMKLKISPWLLCQLMTCFPFFWKKKSNFRQSSWLYTFYNDFPLCCFKPVQEVSTAMSKLKQLCSRLLHRL